MNETETRAELIDPALVAAGWGVVEESRIRREYPVTKGRIQVGGKRGLPLKADYVLIYRGHKLAAIEAKSNEKEVGEGVGQAKDYAHRLNLDTTFAANGKEIYQICMKTGTEETVERFPTPDELWDKTFSKQNEWRDRFAAEPYNDIGKTKPPYYYQENAVEAVLDAVANEEDRILLTLATGTGKTFIAFQIAWKLFQTRWNLNRDGKRRPRILFLADRNILANQAFNSFNAFPEDALVRISPKEIRKAGKVPTNGSIFFTIFQTFMSGPDEEPYFGDYDEDFFDFVIIDECHRGGANDEGNWRKIMEHFSPAVQLGLTATPKRKHNADTYDYFGEPVYVYSLKDGINDGFLTPFKVNRIQTTIDEYFYTPDDEILSGEVDGEKVYEEKDFNVSIEIKERESKRVQLFLDQAKQNEKTIVFCATQQHAALVRDLINQLSDSDNPFYCCRVTANDGAQGEENLKLFQDNEKTIPTILTTSQKLSTGVDARNVRNIVLMRPCTNMIEFKQIIGRGTRTFEGKDYFTIYDFVDAYQNFLDPAWDGEPMDPVAPGPPRPRPEGGDEEGGGTEPPPPPKEKLKIKLSDGKYRAIQSMASTTFWDADGRPISAEEFIQKLFGTLPDFFTTEADLRKIWSDPATRKGLLNKLEEVGYGLEELNTLKDLIQADKSDLFDVLEYVAYAIEPVTREHRVKSAYDRIFDNLDQEQREFIDFVLQRYIETGVEVLDQSLLPQLLELKYHAIADAAAKLGGVKQISQLFIEFQKYLYDQLAV
ncbi:EcoAI/FtnUII family type I restriction enzme subunit R [Thalassoglobus polymorphus]|uniref:Type-1 restriction enzyme R protein n=1 Tax=Thalassoglobus polymorphus TaxID=2527994 RepID=A0A517QT57_9PLAN|nr:type I restriction endonuclease subunit R [Thalassoglobus polymorphus]QDT34819.1 Type-1 restriction enzyme R protein [Thalassoglobus polymorphus]